MTNSNYKKYYSSGIFRQEYIKSDVVYIVCADSNNQIYFTDDDNTRTELIYTGSSTITSLYANTELIYFVEGSVLYHLHIHPILLI